MFDIFDENGKVDLSKLANYSEFLGLFIAIGTLIYSFFIERKLRRVARRVLFDNTLPDANKDLIKTNSEISNSLSNYQQNARIIRRDVLLCETILKNIKKQVDKEERASVDKILGKISRIKQNRIDTEPQIQLTTKQKFKAFFKKPETITEDDIWDLYSANNALIRQVEYSIKNHKKINRYV